MSPDAKKTCSKSGSSVCQFVLCVVDEDDKNRCVILNKNDQQDDGSCFKMFDTRFITGRT